MFKYNFFNILLINILCFFIFSITSLPVFCFEGTLKNFKIPLFSKNMENKGFIIGESVRLNDNGTFEIQKPNAEISIEETGRTWQFKAEQCFLKKETNTIWSDKFIQIRSKDIYIDGKGMQWNLSDGPLVIEKNVTVNLNNSYAEEKKEKLNE